MATLSPTLVHRSHMARFGEPVTLPGAVVVMGIFDLPGVAPALRPRGSMVGARLEVAHQVAPALMLRTEDAAALREQDPVSVRGIEYRVVSLTSDGAGMTHVALLRAGTPSVPPSPWSTWR